MCKVGLGIVRLFVLLCKSGFWFYEELWAVMRHVFIHDGAFKLIGMVCLLLAVEKKAAVFTNHVVVIPLNTP